MDQKTNEVSPFLVISKASLASEQDLLATDFGDGDDCACPDDGLTLAPGQVAPVHCHQTRYEHPVLFQEPLDTEHTLVFNPLAQSGPIILNEASLKLLGQFQTPSTLNQAVLANRDLPGGLATAVQFVTLGLLQPVGQTMQPQRGQPQTLTAWLHVTNACNLRCPYCYLHKTPDEMELEHGRLAINAIFRSAVNNGFRRVKIKYAGGEATLNMKTVLALHDHAAQLASEHQLQLAGVILSNGVSLTNKMIEALRQRQLKLMISLDGVGEVHDGQRPFINGNGSFNHVERTLDRLQAVGFVPTISITITRQNVHSLPETVRYVLKRKLPFSLNFFRDNECASANLAYDEQQIIEAMQKAFAVIEADLPQRSLLGAVLDRTRLDMPHDRPCGVGHSYLVIDQNGRVAKCQMEIEQPVTDVYAPDPLAVAQQDTNHLQNPSVDEKEGCRSCPWRYWCAGGCPALTYRATVRFDVKSPNCNIYQKLFPGVLRLEGQRLLATAA